MNSWKYGNKRARMRSGIGLRINFDFTDVFVVVVVYSGNNEQGTAVYILIINKTTNVRWEKNNTTERRIYIWTINTKITKMYVLWVDKLTFIKGVRL